MIYRSMFVAYSNKPKCVKLKPDCPYYAALAFLQNRVFLYVESNEENVDVENLAVGDFHLYPNGYKWERAAEIFHYSVPMNEKQRQRKTDKTPLFRLNQLKWGRIASYIFYHFQYQEESTGGGDRYGVIFLAGDTLVFYEEMPTEEETEKLCGILNTSNTPHNQWGALMEEHFADEWRQIENLSRSRYIDFDAR